MTSPQGTLIIGAGLTGLLLAHRLTAAGHDVTLVEARDTIGGRFRRASALDFFPATDEAVALLEWTKSVSPTSLSWEIREHRPQIYDDGRWRTFAGFGETEFKSVAELGAFGQTVELRLTPGLDQVIRALSEQLPIAPRTLAEVTALKVADRKVTEVVLNDDKVLHPETVIFTAHPRFLNELIAGDALSAKNRTRLAKMVTWTAVTLELQHTPPLTAEESVLLFNHNAKDFEPVVGRVEGPISRWMTLVPDEHETDVEFIGQNIRHIKRQLKRSWSLDGLSPEEKIYVQPHAYGQQTLKTKDRFEFPEIKNLFVANHLLARLPGALGSLEVAHDVELAMIESDVPLTPRSAPGKPSP